MRIAMQRYLDLDHLPNGMGYRGLAHRGCNRRAGVLVANANRKAMRVGGTRAHTVRQSRAW